MNSSCIFDAVSGLGPCWKGPLLDVASSVKCDFLEVVDTFVSNDENDEKIYLDYSRKAGMMLGIRRTGEMKCAKAVQVERSKLFRARIVLDDDMRGHSYIGSRPK